MASLRIAVMTSTLNDNRKLLYCEKLRSVAVEQLTPLFATSLDTLTIVDKKYIVCFVADIPVRDIATMFNMEAASVYTARYRIRKKFGAEIPF